MISFPRSVARSCRAVFRRAAPRSARCQHPTFNLHAGLGGIVFRLVQPDITVQYHHLEPAEAEAFVLPLTMLGDCEGRGGTVELAPQDSGRIEARWEQASVPHARTYANSSDGASPLPEWPGQEANNAAGLLLALTAAMETAGTDAVRFALDHVQLRGRTGEVVGTDGRQLLVQGGFTFPWDGDLLVPRTTVFAAPELVAGGPVAVAHTDEFVWFRVGPWTLALRINREGRFPDVNRVVPQPGTAGTTLQLRAEARAALTNTLTALPGSRDAHAPVTVDLGRLVVLRARADGDARPTEVAVPAAATEGKPLRVATDRRFLARAAALGFDAVMFPGADKPAVCRDGARAYVWALLDPSAVLPPQPGALRPVPSPAGTGGGRTKKRRARRPKVPAAVVAATAVPVPRNRMFGWLRRLVWQVQTAAAVNREHRRRESFD